MIVFSVERGYLVGSACHIQVKLAVTVVARRWDVCQVRRDRPAMLQLLLLLPLTLVHTIEAASLSAL